MTADPVEIIAAEIGGAGLRTFERLFVEETGLSLASSGDDRSRMLTLTLSLLAEGRPASARSRTSVGYESAAAVSTAFKQCFGTSPSSYWPLGSAPC
jgi:transcriptional regulator GlxA family with amidase domain